MKTSRIVGIVLVKIGERDADELVDAEAAEQAGILFEDADHFVGPAVEPHLLPMGSIMRKQRIGDGLADDDDGARMFLDRIAR